MAKCKLAAATASQAGERAGTLGSATASAGQLRTSVEHLSHHAGAHGAASLADGKPQAGLHSHGGHQLKCAGNVVPRHDHLGARGQSVGACRGGGWVGVCGGGGREGGLAQVKYASAQRHLGARGAGWRCLQGWVSSRGAIEG